MATRDSGLSRPRENIMTFSVPISYSRQYELCDSVFSDLLFAKAKQISYVS